MNARKTRRIKDKLDLCPKCGSSDIAERNYSDTVDFRAMELDVEGLADTKCNQCGFFWTSSAQDESNKAVIRAAYATERDQLRVMHGLLSGFEISKIRDSLGLNQREAAVLFGGGYNAFNKYESGEVLQSFAMDRLLRLTKVIGKPAVRFLRNVDAPLSFVVIPSDRTSALASISVRNLLPANASLYHETVIEGKTRSASKMSSVVVPPTTGRFFEGCTYP